MSLNKHRGTAHVQAYYIYAFVCMIASLFIYTEYNVYISDFIFLTVCLHCFDAVGWAAGRASGL